jgi:hypothetical protein
MSLRAKIIQSVKVCEKFYTSLQNTLETFSNSCAYSCISTIEISSIFPISTYMGLLLMASKRTHDVNLKSYLHHIHNTHSSFTQFTLFLFLFTCIPLFLLFLSPHSHPGMHASLLTRSHSDLKPKTEAAYQQHY